MEWFNLLLLVRSLRILLVKESGHNSGEYCYQKIWSDNR